MSTRREFCIGTCQAVSLLTLSTVLQGCGGGSPTSPGASAPQLPQVSGTVVNGALNVTMEAASGLNSVGGAALVASGAGTFLLARTGAASFTALTAVCTHEGCTVSGFTNSVYVCPCHGSEFSTSGSVVQGPAGAPLRQFATTFANGVVTISLS